MKRFAASALSLFLGCMPTLVWACETPVCRVDLNSLALTQVITFDNLQSGSGPGRYLDDILPLEGATFGERFAGQDIAPQGAHDAIVGTAFSPLTMMPGADGQNLSLVHFSGTTVINGYGAAGFPRRDAQGEGAIAVLFDVDQSAFAFEIRGGEDGTAMVIFHRRDGSVIGQVPVQPTGEFAVAFLRKTGIADIAGFVVTNTDPQGLAIDTLRFGKPPELS